MKHLKRHIFDNMIITFLSIYFIVAGPQIYLDSLNSSEGYLIARDLFGLIGYYFLCVISVPLFCIYIRYIIDIIVRKTHTKTITVIKNAKAIRYTTDNNQYYYIVKAVTNDNKRRAFRIDEKLIENIKIRKGEEYLVTYYIFSNVVVSIENG